MTHTTQRTSWFQLSAISTATAATLILTACGGGGTGDSTTSSGTSATTSSYTGTVSGLGSIVVNGVRFSVDSASTQDGDDPSKSYAKAFALGDTVTVTGTVNSDGTTGTATSVVYHGGVRGKVTAVNCTSTADSTNGPANSLTINGQVVVFSSDTVWDGSATTYACASLVAGTSYAEALGDYDSATGYITATRVIEKDSTTVDASGVALRRKITAVDSTVPSFTVTIHGVTVTVNYTASDVAPSGSTLATGNEVRFIVDPTVTANATALNTIATSTSGTATLTAKKVIVKRERQADAVKGVIRGSIDAISGTTWTIGGTTVDVSSSSLTLTGYSSLSAVAVGDKVIIKGTFSNGVLVASAVTAASSDSDRPTATGGVRLYGVVSDATAASGSTAATFVVQGVTVTIASTSTLSLPTNGVYAEVKAHLVSGVLTADEIHTASTSSSSGSSSGSGSSTDSSSSTTTSRSFEVYGVTPCATGTASDFTSTFALTLRRGSVQVAPTSSTTVTVDSNVTTGSVTSGTPLCLVEVTGTAATGTTTPTITATKIEVKARKTASSSDSTTTTTTAASMLR